MRAVTVVRSDSGSMPVEAAVRAALDGSPAIGCTLNVPLDGAGHSLPPAPADLVAVVEWEYDSETSLEETLAALAAESGPARLDSYRVEVTQPATYERTWDLGEPSPGVRMLSLCQRRNGLSRDEYARYWREQHTPIAMSFTVPIWNYTQTVVIEAISADAPALDGVAGLHFRSIDEWRTRYIDHPDEAKRGAEDGARFMDMARGETIFATETTLTLLPVEAAR